MQTQTPIKNNPHEDGDFDGLGCARGIIWATPVGFACWVLILWLIFG